MKIGRQVMGVAATCAVILGACGGSNSASGVTGATEPPADEVVSSHAAHDRTSDAPATAPISAVDPTQDYSGEPASHQGAPATLPLSRTEWFSPTRGAGLEGGDNDGFESNARAALIQDGREAVDRDSGTSVAASCYSAGKDRNLFRGFGASLPRASAMVDGIEVRFRARADTSVGKAYFCVQLSWNGGRGWTYPQRSNQLTDSARLVSAGHAREPWGRAWTAPELSNDNLRVRITEVSDDGRRDFFLDSVDVRVTYH